MREAGLKAAEEAATKMDAASDPDAVKAALERIRSNVIEHGETSKKKMRKKGRIVANGARWHEDPRRRGRRR